MQRWGAPAKRLAVLEASPTQQFVETVSLYFERAQKACGSLSLNVHTFIEVDTRSRSSIMALNNLPTKGKLLEVQDGTKYAYVYVPATDSKPTFLLLHGFPSSSYDWRHQIKSLTELGFGVLAPDLLGYGDTDRPTEIEKYKFKKMTADVVDILDEESLKTVIGVAHDW